jgi:hypothetical protein
MAKVDYDALQAAQILEALRSLGFYGSADLSGLSKKDITNLLKDYSKSVRTTFDEQDDIISGKYEPNSPMGRALAKIAGGLLPETVEADLFAEDVIPTAEQSKDLQDYSSYISKRNESMRERMYNLGETAGEYGLSDPSSSFAVDPAIAANYFRVDEQGKSLSKPVLDEARATQDAYNQYLTMKQSGQDTSNFNMADAIKERMLRSALNPNAESRPGITVNGVYYPTVQDYENQITAGNLVNLPYNPATTDAEVQELSPWNTKTDLSQYIVPLGKIGQGSNAETANTLDSEAQEMRDEYANSMFGPTISSFYAANQSSPGVKLPPPPPQQGARVSEPKKVFDYRGSMANAASILAQNEMMKDKMVADALRNRLRSNFGSPFESDISAAQKALEERLAYEAWLSEEKKRKKARGF